MHICGRDLFINKPGKLSETAAKVRFNALVRSSELGNIRPARIGYQLATSGTLCEPHII